MAEETGTDAFAGGEGVIHETAAEHTVFPPFDATTFASQLLWFVITFAVFYYVMAKVALPRIAAILESRRGRIASDLDQAERFRSDSQTAAAAYEKALADARGKASGIAESARAAAKAKADAHQHEVEGELGKKLAASDQRIAEIKERALADVGVIAGETANAVVDALVDIEVAESDIAAAVSSVMGERNDHA